MKLDLSQLSEYRRRIDEERSRMESARDKLKFYRLQVKQTRGKAMQAKRDATLREFIAAMPRQSVTVTPAPDAIYASVSLNPLCACDLRHVPDKLGLERREQRPLHADQLASPILTVYRKGPVLYYVTEYVK